MSTNKHIEKICCVAVVFALLITLLFMNGESLGLQIASKVTGYETRLFNINKVHTIDIVMNDWEGFLETCENEEYVMCNVVIDGEAFKNIGIRAKGNTSLSNVSRLGSDRYSFKLEFDQYDSTKSYHGLDKLSLNNLIQDNTMMKDFLVYQMMNKFGVDAPLCSYVYITVNGQDFGLYLAVEGVEDGFLQRNYGQDSGELYKPDSLSFGGGRGNGKSFDMDDFDAEYFESRGAGSDMMPPDRMEQGNNMMPSGGTVQGGNMGSDDVKLQYIDDNPSSYSNIFDNAKTDIDSEDQIRLIAALKTLSSGEDLEDAVNIEKVIRYFVVHNFVVNGDSYTGSMIHNYYLYEKDGLLSMIPWDYNLAFGTFSGSDATAAINEPIDSPVSGSNMEDRPMVAWIFENEEYTELYHQYFTEFLTTCFTTGYFTELIDSTTELIAPYVEKDPTKFCTYDEFENGVTTIKEFCLLRAESVQGQLEGSIPSTSETQATNRSALVDASAISLSDMGDMGDTMGKPMGGMDGMVDPMGGDSKNNGFGDRFNDRPGDDFENITDGNNGFDGNIGEPPNHDNDDNTFGGTNDTDNTVILLFAASVVLLFGALFAVTRLKR